MCRVYKPTRFAQTDLRNLASNNAQRSGCGQQRTRTDEAAHNTPAAETEPAREHEPKRERLQAEN
jgi:hypothetical protein